MGALRFDGVDDIISFSTLAQALKDVTDGAWTCCVVVKRANTGNTYQGMSVLRTAGANEAGISWMGSGGGATQNSVYIDVNAVNTPTGLTDTTNPYMLVVSKGAGTVTPRLGRKLGSGGAWTHENFDGTLPDQIDATILEIGASTLSTEFLNGWLGVVAWWEGAMSDADKEALDNNWSTSDLYNSAHGTPVFLAEFNVAGSSVVDLAGNATGRAVTGTTLDAAETLNSWNFDGVGGGGGTSETPTPGGATAGGNGPLAQAVAPQGGAASVAGTAPTTRAPVPQGGGDGAGTAPTSAAVVAQGGAVGAGVEPGSTTTATPVPGGVDSAGAAPSPRATVGVGGAQSAGTDPTALATATPTVGGADAAGTSPGTTAPTGVGSGTGEGTGPIARVDSGTGGGLAAGTAPSDSSSTSETPTPGGGVAGGQGPTAKATSDVGGSTGAGNAPAATTTVGQGGGTLAGVGPLARADVTPGGGVAGGAAPSDSGGVSETPTPGGGLAAGVEPTAKASSTISGATAAGASPAPAAAAGVGGGLADGTDATAQASATPAPGGVVGAGSGPASAVSAGVGGAAVSGFSPGAVLVLVTRGGGVADGFDIVDGSELAVPNADLHLRVIAVFPRIAPIVNPLELRHLGTPVRLRAVED